MPTSGMDYTKVENIFQPVSAAYASMRLGEGEAQSYVSVLSVAEDDTDAGSDPQDAAAVTEAFDKFGCLPTNTHVNNMWIYFYDIASSANYAIESMDKFAEAMTAADALKTVDECRGEAKIIRAYAYFNLVRLFGSVPLIDKTMTSSELGNFPASPVSKVYEFIYKDLDDAISVVPESHTELGRYNKFTAMALKAKVALYNNDWDEAAAQADAVMASGNYSLYPDFREMFLPAGEYCSESLMEVGCDDLGQSKGNAPVGFYAFIQGPRNNQPSNMQGWGYKVPSQTLVDFLTERGETVRLETTILRRGATTPEGDLIMETCPMPYYNGKVYTPSKFNSWAYNGYGFDHNMRLLRYADVLLIYAEAMVQGATVNDPKSGYTADQALNEVRQRAGLGAASADLQTIWDERRAEFAMEENRFFDLVRTGQAAAVLGPLGFKSGKNEIFPTPATQIQVNTGLSQTPGYTY